MPATTAAQAPVPQASVSPAPRSNTRRRMRARSTTCTNPALTRRGNRACRSISAPSSATGAASTISYSTLAFENAGNTRFKPTQLLDLSAQKVFNFRGGKNRVKLMFDAFNVFNTNTITAYSSNNRSSSLFTSPTTIVPPRVFRIGAQINF